MEKPVKGDVVVVSFPFSDLSTTKRRPAVVLAVLEGTDTILCQITSRQTKDRYAISFSQANFLSGTLNQESSIRPNKLFTADQTILLYKAGSLNKNKLAEAIEKTCQILKE